jgi:hypothetical protein
MGKVSLNCDNGDRLADLLGLGDEFISFDELCDAAADEIVQQRERLQRAGLEENDKYPVPNGAMRHPLPWFHFFNKSTRITAVVDAKGNVIAGSLICEAFAFPMAAEAHSHIVRAVEAYGGGQ